MKDVLSIGQMLSVHARLRPNDLGAHDLDRSLTFAQWNRRACRLANALLGIGLKKGDRFAILAYNTLEWAEIYMAAAKAGLIALPINFRLVGSEVRFIIENAEASALIVQDDPCASTFPTLWSSPNRLSPGPCHIREPSDATPAPSLRS